MLSVLLLFTCCVLNQNVLASEESPKDVNVVIYVENSADQIDRIIKIKTDTCTEYDENAYVRVNTISTGYEVKCYEKDAQCDERNWIEKIKAEVKDNVDKELKSCGETIRSYEYDSTCTEKKYDFPYYACACEEDENYDGEYSNKIFQRKGNTWFLNLYSDAECKKVSRRKPDTEIEGGVCVKTNEGYLKLPAFSGSVAMTVLLVLLIAVLI